MLQAVKERLIAMTEIGIEPDANTVQRYAHNLNASYLFEGKLIYFKDHCMINIWLVLYLCFTAVWELLPKRKMYLFS